MITRRDHLTTAKVDEMSVTVNESPIRYYTPGGGGNSAYERGGDTRRKFWIKLLKETYLGVAQAFFVP